MVAHVTPCSAGSYLRLCVISHWEHEPLGFPTYNCKPRGAMMVFRYMRNTAEIKLSTSGIFIASKRISPIMQENKIKII